jgi:uncharacterized protein
MQEAILTTPYLSSRISKLTLQQFSQQLSTSFIELNLIEGEVEAVCRDPKDDYLLAYALLGQADYLVSYDKDLTDLKEHQGVVIVHPAEFIHILRQQANSDPPTNGHVADEP